MRFLDTMSLHIMCSGFTHAQRIQYQAFEKGSLANQMIKMIFLKKMILMNNIYPCY